MNNTPLHQAQREIRVFVAIPVAPDGVPGIVHTQQLLDEDARQRRVGWRLTPSSQLHVTLAFVGNTRPSQLESIFAAIAEKARSLAAFTLRATRLVALPSARRASVVAISFEESSGQLSDFASALQVQLGCGVVKKPFLPHVTIARLRFPRRVPNWSSEGLAHIPSFLAREVVVFRSVLLPSGAEYHRLWSLELGNPRLNATIVE